MYTFYVILLARVIALFYPNLTLNKNGNIPVEDGFVKITIFTA